MTRRFLPLQFSLRTLLVVLMPLAAVFALCVRSRETKIVRTGNPLDVAIEGPGYFCVTDKFDRNRRFTRSGRLGVSAGGQLVMRIGGEECYLAPPIKIPSDGGDLSKTLKILANGDVRLQSPDWDYFIGNFLLDTFADTNLPQFDQTVFVADEETGPPTTWLPAATPPGQILQGYRELRGWRWDGESIVTLLVGFVLGVVATWLLRGSNVKMATASRAPSSESPSAP
jgi:hypothetical protein